MEITIQNQAIKAVIKTKGAELSYFKKRIKIIFGKLIPNFGTKHHLYFSRL
jgi:hypothetical protein